MARQASAAAKKAQALRLAREDVERAENELGMCTVVIYN
jgi:hypothetical protein